MGDMAYAHIKLAPYGRARGTKRCEQMRAHSQEFSCVIRCDQRTANHVLSSTGEHLLHPDMGLLVTRRDEQLT